MGSQPFGSQPLDLGVLPDVEAVAGGGGSLPRTFSFDPSQSLPDVTELTLEQLAYIDRGAAADLSIIEVEPNYPPIEPKTIEQLREFLSIPIEAKKMKKTDLQEMYKKSDKYLRSIQTTNTISLLLPKDLEAGDIIQLSIKDEGRKIYLRLNRAKKEKETILYELSPYGKAPITSSKLFELLNIADFLRQFEVSDGPQGRAAPRPRLNINGSGEAYITITPYGVEIGSEEEQAGKYYLKIKRHSKQNPRRFVGDFFEKNLPYDGKELTKGTNYELLQKASNVVEEEGDGEEDGMGIDEANSRKRATATASSGAARRQKSSASSPRPGGEGAREDEDEGEDDPLVGIQNDILTNPPFVLRVDSIGKAQDLVQVDKDGIESEELIKRLNPMRILTSGTDAEIASDVLWTITKLLEQNSDMITYLAQFRDIKHDSDDPEPDWMATREGLYEEGAPAGINGTNISASYVEKMLETAICGLKHRESMRVRTNTGHEQFYVASKVLLELVTGIAEH
jgi:hypothetical protein